MPPSTVPKPTHFHTIEPNRSRGRQGTGREKGEMRIGSDPIPLRLLLTRRIPPRHTSLRWAHRARQILSPCQSTIRQSSTHRRPPHLDQPARLNFLLRRINSRRKLRRALPHQLWRMRSIRFRKGVSRGWRQPFVHE